MADWVVVSVTGEGVLVYQNNDRCEAIFEHGALIEPTRFIRHDADG
jgi:hypothetical protein